MNERRLITCFQTVFPDLPEAKIPSATQATVSEWDSIAGITLMNVIEEEFKIPIDFDAMAELDSFPRILNYIDSQNAS